YRAETRLSLVDVADVGEAAAVVLTEPGHEQAIYPLCGHDAPTQTEVAQMLAAQMGRPVQVAVADQDKWQRQAAANGLGAYRIETLLKMFAYYDQFDFVGNGKTLRWLLARPSTRFEAFLAQLAGKWP
ncbi:MAG: hypothetical protein ACE5EY_04290, partial [Anaerolineae bacterium]